MTIERLEQLKRYINLNMVWTEHSGKEVDSRVTKIGKDLIILIDAEIKGQKGK